MAYLAKFVIGAFPSFLVINIGRETFPETPWRFGDVAPLYNKTAISVRQFCHEIPQVAGRKMGARGDKGGEGVEGEKKAYLATNARLEKPRCFIL